MFRLTRATTHALRTARPTSILRSSISLTAQSQSQAHQRIALSSHRAFSSTPARPAAKTSTDDIIEEITELYGTARDEFEIATEETEKGTTYAAGDREAAREEWEKLKARYDEVLESEHGEEVRRRIGGRIRELENAIGNMEP